MLTTSQTIVNDFLQTGTFSSNPIVSENLGASPNASSEDYVSGNVGLAPLEMGESNRLGNHGTSKSVARIYAPIDKTLAVSIPPEIDIHSVDQLTRTFSPQPEKRGTEYHELPSSVLPQVGSSQQAKSVLDIWEYMTVEAASIREETRDIPEKFTEGGKDESNRIESDNSTQADYRPPEHPRPSIDLDASGIRVEKQRVSYQGIDLTGLKSVLALKVATDLAPLQLCKESTSPLVYTHLMQQCQNSVVNKAFDIVETVVETRLPALEQDPLPCHTQEETLAVSHSLDPEQADKTGGADMVDALIYDSRITNKEIKNEENAPDDRVSALWEVGSSLVQAGISSATGKIVDTPAGAVLQTASGMLSTASSTLHIQEGENTESGVLNLVMSRSLDTTLGSLPFNTISEGTINHTGLGKVIATASEVIAVAEAVKSGDATTILEDEHLQELGKKALDVGLGFAASAILTASGAGTVMAVASAASEVIAATKEAKNIENEKYGLTGFVLETGTKIALDAAIKGSGAGVVLDIAAPILEPLCQEVISQATEHGVEFIDQAARSVGVEDILKNGLDAVVQVEETATSRVLGLEAQVVKETIPTAFQANEGMVQRVTGVTTRVTEDSHENKTVANQEDTGIATPIFPINETTQEVPKADIVMKQAHLQPPSTHVHFESMDKIIDITSSNFLGGTTVTVVSSAMDAVNAKLTGSFEPTRAGLDLLEFLCHVSEGSSTVNVNGLSTTAITKTYELVKSEVTNDAGRHRTLFDPDGDGIVHYGDTVQALAFLGLRGFAARLAAYSFHVMFSYPTGDEWLPRFKTSLPIHIKNMSRTIQGRNWGTLDRAKFITESCVQEFFSGSMCLGPRAFQILLFLLEWGTMWPFHIPSARTDETPKPEEISPVFTSAIIPMVLKHWALFRESNNRGRSAHQSCPI